jgi:hypothetical protein
MGNNLFKGDLSNELSEKLIKLINLYFSRHVDNRAWIRVTPL